MARLRSDEIQMGDRLRYRTSATTEVVGRVDGLERGKGTPDLVLFTYEDGSAQIIMRLGELARHSTRVRDPELSIRG